MKSIAKAKEAGDDFWEEDARSPRVTAASLIVPKEISRELFHPDGRIADKRLETIQIRCYCDFRLTKLPARNPGSKICDRLIVEYSYPTKNHQVMLRLFNDLVQHIGASLCLASRVKVCCNILHLPPRAPGRSKSAHVGSINSKSATTAQQQLEASVGDVILLTSSSAAPAAADAAAVTDSPDC